MFLLENKLIAYIQKKAKMPENMLNKNSLLRFFLEKNGKHLHFLQAKLSFFRRIIAEKIPVNVQ